MQAATRTPNSILRKRPNKENEDATGKLNKRNKLANRRVSFAPDDELETKHIFKEDSYRPSTADLPTAHGLCPAQAVSAAVAPMGPSGVQLAGDATAVLPSPENLSPLSMDLTNNSFERPCAAPAPASGAVSTKGSNVGGPVAGPSLQPQHLAHPQHAPYARMDITLNVPNLSTLVEEDEEDYSAGGVSSNVGQNAEANASPHSAVLNSVGAGYLPTESPMSPNSVREMQMCCDSEHQAEREGAPVEHFWGFAPGKDDTLEVNYRNAVMGDKTYNHVYGTGSIVDLTRATGHTFLQTGGVTRLLAAGPAPREPFAVHGSQSPARAGPEAGGTTTTMARVEAVAAAAAPAGASGRGLAGVPGGTDTGGRAEAAAAEQAPAFVAAAAAPVAQQSLWQAPSQRPQPQHPQPSELSAIQAPPVQSVNVPPGLAPQPLQTRTQVHSTPFLDNTMRLLEDDQTEAWRLPGYASAYDRGRLSVASNRVLPPGYRRGAGAGETTMLLGPTMTLASAGNGHTVQLLADTTTQRGAYERIVQKMPGLQASPAAMPPPPRPGGAGGKPEGPAAASSAAVDHRHTAYNARIMSMEMKLGGSGDLLEDCGLSLDAHFQLPPEPTMALSQLQTDAQPRQRPVQVAAVGAQAAALPAASRGAPPRLSCQEFLGVIDVGFINKICRDTFQPGSDPAPKSVAEVYEAATCTSAYVDAYHARSLDLTARLANMGISVAKLEAELTAGKQELFAAVQMLPVIELEAVKEKFARLKELCRLRTVKQIKQTQLGVMEDHLAHLCARKLQLQADLDVVTAEFERLNTCAREANAIPEVVTRMRQEDEERAQEAAQRKRTLEAHMQRLQALRDQNAERQRRLLAAQAEHQAKTQSRPPITALLDERCELEALATALRGRLNTNPMTPGREGQLICQAARKADTVEAILGLHGLRLDLTAVEQTGAFKLFFRRAYCITCIASNGSMAVHVSCQDAAAAGVATLAPSIRDHIQASATALSCTVPRAQLPLRLEYTLEQLQRMLRLAHQLERCWVRFDCMQRPRAEVVDRGEPSLVLRFINADTATGVTIRMAWSAALRSDYVKPQLTLEFTSLEPVETQRQYCDALLDTVLSKLAPSREYLTAVCYAMNETLHVPGDGTV